MATSETVYLRNPMTGETQELKDPAPKDLVPFMVQGYHQYDPSEEQPVAIAAQVEQTRLANEPAATSGELKTNVTAAPGTTVQAQPVPARLAATVPTASAPVAATPVAAPLNPMTPVTGVKG